jgi:hypothetical protein
MSFFENYTIGSSTIILVIIVLIVIFIGIIYYNSVQINNTVNETADVLDKASADVTAIAEALRPYIEASGGAFQFLQDNSEKFKVTYCATLDTYCYKMASICETRPTGIERPRYCDRRPGGFEPLFFDYCICIQCLQCDSGCPGACNNCNETQRAQCQAPPPTSSSRFSLNSILNDLEKREDGDEENKNIIKRSMEYFIERLNDPHNLLLSGERMEELYESNKGENKEREEIDSNYSLLDYGKERSFKKIHGNVGRVKVLNRN